MKRLLLLMAFFSPSLLQAEDKDFVPLFNGKDLSNWVNVNCAPETFTVKDGMIHCTGKPIGALRTPKMYENFVLELEWRHLEVGGNSGVFIWATPLGAPGVPFLRGIEVQVLDNGYNVKGKNEWYTTHGDIFPIHGASMKPIYKGNGQRCFPIEERSKSSPEWNHYRVTGNKGTLRLEVNGKQVSGGDECNYCKGYLGLESEGGAIDFRNIKIKELPPTDAPKDRTAPEAKDWKPLYTGVDLRGWKAKPNTSHWKVDDWQILALANPEAEDLWSEVSAKDFEVIFDRRLPEKADATKPMEIKIGNEKEFRKITAPSYPGWTRYTLTMMGNRYSVMDNRGGKTMSQEIPEGSLPSTRSIGLMASSSVNLNFANLYFRELK
ncbi:DUF1080 domain-containing protein [Telmatocola sphagniphila]|uniref:DUF1080 domain-containing protein n=1 Tax=Telmatocola sphagniphila TaxID=1123043 RepID=A0A8E6EXB3_9BACT|nr:family 16 glycoside hydrolase [Telmatocola sphagniphila]QVL34702.1 DUF1080 domain-containing protein [Telmatocola sphagniphila]